MSAYRSFKFFLAAGVTITKWLGSSSNSLILTALTGVFLPAFFMASLNKLVAIVAEPRCSSWRIKFTSLTLLKSIPIIKPGFSAGLAAFSGLSSTWVKALKLATIWSYLGLLKKLPTETCIAFGAFWRARSVNSSWVITNNPSSSFKFLTAVLVTGNLIPAFLNLSRSKDAPIADEPIPASQAKITFLISAYDLTELWAFWAEGISCPLDSDFIDFICFCFSANSSPVPLSLFKIIAATTNETIAAPKTPTKLPK